MRNEFNFDHIQSVEFCVSVQENGEDANYLVPIDQSVQNALKQVLEATLTAIEPEENWSPYELSEKYGSKESLRAASPRTRWLRFARCTKKKGGQ